MGLINLLSVGRSFMGSGPGHGHYKLAQENLIPTFRPGRVGARPAEKNGAENSEQQTRADATPRRESGKSFSLGRWIGLFIDR
jgi:hypothetical protein